MTPTVLHTHPTPCAPQSASCGPLRLGITGGIGCGKSYVAGLLRERWNIPVYDCDSEAKRLTATSLAIRQALAALVGENLWQEGQLRKERLAAYLFASPGHAAQVNAIIHPAVRQDFLRWVGRHKDFPVVVMESAILCESGFHTLVDDILLVDAPREVRLQRAMNRDGATRAQVEARMARQDDTQARALARFVVDNGNVSRDTLLARLQTVMDALLQPSQSPAYDK